MSLPTRYPHVFSPLAIRAMTLKNRIQFSPRAVSDPKLLQGRAFAPSVIPGIHDPVTTEEIDRAEMAIWRWRREEGSGHVV